MDLSALRLLLEVAQAGSFAEAARRYDLDPSLVSRRIGRLEEEIGFRLFQRTTRRVALTEAGRRFVEAVGSHLDAIEDAQHAGRDHAGQPSGTLRVTASSSFGHTVIVPLLDDFRRIAPDVKLELMLTDRRLDLIEDQVDVAIRLGTLEDSGMISRRIMPIAFRLYALPSVCESALKIHSPKELEGVDCLTYPGSVASGTVAILTKKGREKVRLNGPIAISNALALKQCALNGLGPALLPDWLVADDLAAGSLIDCFPDWTFVVGEADQAAWFLYPSRAYLPLKARRFMDFIYARLSRKGAGGSPDNSPNELRHRP